MKQMSFKAAWSEAATAPRKPAGPPPWRLWGRTALAAYFKGALMQLSGPAEEMPNRLQSTWWHQEQSSPRLQGHPVLTNEVWTVPRSSSCESSGWLPIRSIHLIIVFCWF